MGFDYIYQGNANNISDMIETFKKVKDIDHPIVIHIHTEKGHGFAPAIKDKERWHWSMPFDLETGESKVSFDGEDYSSITYDFLQKEMKKDPTIVAVTSATPTIAGFYPAQRKAAGKQHIDVGIAEEEAVAMISGMAKGDSSCLQCFTALFCKELTTSWLKTFASTRIRQLSMFSQPPYME